MKRDYYIKIPHFYSFEYYQGTKKMIIELDFRDRVLYLDTDLITKWEKPFETMEISHEEKLKILHNIRECLLERWRPEEVVIEDEPERM